MDVKASQSVCMCGRSSVHHYHLHLHHVDEKVYPTTIKQWICSEICLRAFLKTYNCPKDFYLKVFQGARRIRQCEVLEKSLNDEGLLGRPKPSADQVFQEVSQMFQEITKTLSAATQKLAVVTKDDVTAVKANDSAVFARSFAEMSQNLAIVQQMINGMKPSIPSMSSC